MTPPLDVAPRPAGYCVGKSKVFFKGSQLPALESRLAALRAKRAIALQAHARRRLASAFYRRARAAIPRVQAAARRRAAVRAAHRMRQAATTLGRTCRGIVARRRVLVLKRVRAATRLQAVHRGGALRRGFHSKQRAVVRLQAWMRMKQQKASFREKLEKKRLQATYEGQLKDAKARLEEEVAGPDRTQAKHEPPFLASSCRAGCGAGGGLLTRRPSACVAGQRAAGADRGEAAARADAAALGVVA